MRNLLRTLPILLLFLGLECAAVSAQTTGAPHLEKRGAATQLIVDGKPFLMLSGELHNSSSSNLEYMKPIWPKLKGMGLNSVVTPLELGTDRAEGRQLRFHACRWPHRSGAA